MKAELSAVDEVPRSATYPGVLCGVPYIGQDTEHPRSEPRGSTQLDRYPSHIIGEVLVGIWWGRKSKSLAILH